MPGQDATGHIDLRRVARSVQEVNTAGTAAARLLSAHADGAVGAGNGRHRLLEDDDDLAFGVPFAEIPQRFGHLIQPIAAVDDRG